MKILSLIFLAAAAFAISSCNNGGGSSSNACSSVESAAGLASLLHQGKAVGTMSTTVNQVPVVLGCNYVNEITTSVTICEPSNPTVCQTIPNVLVDTGSNGLRIFNQLINISLSNVTDGATPAKTYGTCVTYADGSSHWGPVKMANIQIGGVVAKNVPMQAIDATFGSVPTSCTNLETNPAATGYNGIVGVGLLSADCPSCVTADYGFNQNPQYYGCSGSTCTTTCYTSGGHTNCGYTKGEDISLANMVTNPISQMTAANNGGTAYDNGVSISIPNIPAAGAGPSIGTLTVGVGTVANNTPSNTVRAFTADSSLSFQTTYKSNATWTSSFIDSGSNAYYFPDNISNCSISNFTFYCPANTTSETATMASASGGATGGTGSTTVAFIVTNAAAALSSSNTNSVFPGYAGGGPSMSPAYFDWGLPFFLGRTVYVGINGKTANWITFTSGVTTVNPPYWAFDTTLTPAN